MLKHSVYILPSEHEVLEFQEKFYDYKSTKYVHLIKVYVIYNFLRRLISVIIFFVDSLVTLIKDVGSTIKTSTSLVRWEMENSLDRLIHWLYVFNLQRLYP